MVVLAWSEDPESCAGGSVTTGKVSHARQVIDDDQDEKRYPGSPRSGVWYVRPKTSRRKKRVHLAKNPKDASERILGIKENGGALKGGNVSDGAVAPYMDGYIGGSMAWCVCVCVCVSERGVKMAINRNISERQ